MSTQENNWFGKEVHTTHSGTGVIRDSSSPQWQEDGRLRSFLQNHGDCNRENHFQRAEEKLGKSCDWAQRKMWRSSKISTENSPRFPGKRALGTIVKQFRNWLQSKDLWQGRDSWFVCQIRMLFYCCPCLWCSKSWTWGGNVRDGMRTFTGLPGWPRTCGLATHEGAPPSPPFWLVLLLPTFYSSNPLSAGVTHLPYTEQ